MATEEPTPAGRLAAMADALDAAADVYEVQPVGVDLRHTLWDAVREHLDPAGLTAGRQAVALSHIIPVLPIATRRSPLVTTWLLRALALGLRRDAETLDRGGDS